MDNLARLINLTAKSDKSGPPNWATDEVLKAVEWMVIHTDRDPAMFALICATALASVTDPYNLALVKLGMLNGARRQDDANIETVRAMFKGQEAKISALPPGPRKERLSNFLRYQGRVFMARNGLYQEAMALEQEEIGASVRLAEKSVSRFLAQLYHIWAKISADDADDGLRELIRTLPVALCTLQTYTKGTNLEVLWGLANGPIHMLQVILLTGAAGSGLNWRVYLELVCQHQSEIPPTFNGWIQVIEAASAESMADKLAGLQNVLESNATADAKAAAQLSLARLERQMGNLAKAREYYEAIRPVPMGHMIAAVAKRELAALGA